MTGITRHNIPRLLLPLLFLSALAMMCFAGPAQASSRPPRVLIRKANVAPAHRTSSSVIIYVGDSRTSFEAWNTSGSTPDTVFICKSGTKANYMGTIMPKIRAAMKTYPNASVVLNFGCNGNGSVSANFRNVRRQYDKLIRKYPRRKIYVAAVYPTRYKTGAYGDKGIRKLNKKLKSRYSSRYIDVYSFIRKKKLVNSRWMVDSLHYNDAANHIILQYIRDYINP